MCLEQSQRILGKGNGSGYAYKVVELINGQMRNYYRNANPTIYEIGVTSEVTDKKYIYDDYGKRYRCGIHLYVEPIDNQGVSYFDKYDGRTCKNIAVILCKYERAVSTDGEQLVALKVTPIKIIQQS